MLHFEEALSFACQCKNAHCMSSCDGWLRPLEWGGTMGRNKETSTHGVVLHWHDACLCAGTGPGVILL